MRVDDFTQLLYEIRDGVAWLTLNRPGKKNAMTPELYNELRWGIRFASLDDSVDVIVITGAGAAFCSGGDLAEALRRLEANDVASLYDFSDNAPFFEIRDTSKTVIAAVNGQCYAGGLVIALYCDLSIAVRSATFALSEARVGLADPYAPAALFGRTPAPQVKRLLFTGCVVDADEALGLGLIGEVVDDAAFTTRLHELIGEVRSTSPISRGIYKRYLNELMPRPMGSGGVEVHQTAAALEGLRAFVDKRRADYRPSLD